MSVLYGGDQYNLGEDQLSTGEKLRLLGSVLVLSLALTGILVVRGTPAPPVTVGVGGISPRDIVAPRSVTYASQVLTERARQAAEAAVGTVYDASNPAVARQQVSLARQTLDRISAIRDDADSPRSAKFEALARLEGVVLAPTSGERILDFSEGEWLLVERETVRVLEQSMRSIIREADLADVRRRVPALISFDLTEPQAAVVVDLVSDLVAANTAPNLERTAEMKRRARESVEPITTSWQAGQVVVRAGDRVTELQVEALEHIGLMAPARDWRQDAAALLSVLLVMLLAYLHIAIREPEVGRDWRRLGTLAVAGLLFAGLARLLVVEQPLLPYVYPAAALPMLAAVLVSPALALVIALLPAVFYVHLAAAPLELAAYGAAAAIAGVLLLSRVRHLKAFVWAGLLVLVTNVAVLVIFRLPGEHLGAAGLAGLFGAAAASAALAASIALIGYLLVGGMLGGITSLQLLELSRPTQPLLRQLLLQAPGTHNHSLMVANMAEQAAERMGADALLARVGAYYHDVGKIARPYFYSENQQEGVNVHDRLDPGSSAEIIVGHVREGLDYGKRYRLPAPILAFIAEHHGRCRQDYFYAEAVKRYGEAAVNEEQFRYPGPRPRSRETCIVMLADACEAAVRAAKPQSLQELSRMVERIVDDRMLEGELDECPMTLHDIAAAKVAFVHVLQGLFHPRIQYPEAALIAQRSHASLPGPPQTALQATDGNGAARTHEQPAPSELAEGRGGGE